MWFLALVLSAAHANTPPDHWIHYGVSVAQKGRDVGYAISVTDTEGYSLEGLGVWVKRYPWAPASEPIFQGETLEFHTLTAEDDPDGDLTYVFEGAESCVPIGDWGYTAWGDCCSSESDRPRVQVSQASGCASDSCPSDTGVAEAGCSVPAPRRTRWDQLGVGAALLSLGLLLRRRAP